MLILLIAILFTALILLACASHLYQHCKSVKCQDALALKNKQLNSPNQTSA